MSLVHRKERRRERESVTRAQTGLFVCTEQTGVGTSDNLIRRTPKESGAGATDRHRTWVTRSVVGSRPRALERVRREVRREKGELGSRRDTDRWTPNEGDAAAVLTCSTVKEKEGVTRYGRDCSFVPNRVVGAQVTRGEHTKRIACALR